MPRHIRIYIKSGRNSKLELDFWVHGIRNTFDYECLRQHYFTALYCWGTERLTSSSASQSSRSAFWAGHLPLTNICICIWMYMPRRRRLRSTCMKLHRFPTPSYCVVPCIPFFWARAFTRERSLVWRRVGAVVDPSVRNKNRTNRLLLPVISPISNETLACPEILLQQGLHKVEPTLRFEKRSLFWNHPHRPLLHSIQL